MECEGGGLLAHPHWPHTGRVDECLRALGGSAFVTTLWDRTAQVLSAADWSSLRAHTHRLQGWVLGEGSRVGFLRFDPGHHVDERDCVGVERG
jgi:hypothetical protein